MLDAQRYVQDGYRVVVDVDLEKFFDRVNHDILMERLARRVDDKAVLRLIRRYLVAGIMDGGVVMERFEGTPQGGPLSPLLANVLLDEVDRELERRGHRFVRYADDCNVYVRSRRAGERVLAGLTKLYDRLHLKVSDAKTAVAPASRRPRAASFWAMPSGTAQADRSSAGWPTRRSRPSSNVSGNSHVARAGAICPRLPNDCGPTCRAGRRTSSLRRHPRCSANSTSGSGTGCVRCSSSIGVGARRCTGS
ncbi:RNA-directed DNA polymerase (Reverse transcriptase) [Thauera sp. 63]|nr:RNA-directed DNA polymerase (Reverse transcriptase) [Thauera sp. 63]